MSDPRDREFHDEDLSALYQSTRDLEPPAWLDQRILKAAEASVRPSATPAVPQQRHFGHRRRRSWRLSAALAATVVLAVSVVQLARETGEWRPSAESEEIHSPAEPVVEADVADHAAGSSKSRTLDQAPASAASLRPTMPMGEAVRVAPQSAPLPAILVPSAPPVPSSINGVSRSRTSQAAPAPAPAPAEAERQEMPLLQAEPADAGGHESAGSSSNLPAYHSPEAWLAAIAELRREGRTVEAEENLAAFRQCYPDFDVTIQSPPLAKGGEGGFVSRRSCEIPPSPPFSKGGGERLHFDLEAAPAAP